jgi:hypothetical protein
LTFREKGSENIEILFGTVDEEILRSQVGTELCKGSSHIWCENAVKGVTDTMPGTLWKREYGDEILKKN